jgi:TonB-dependent SusC/RagA subfamily outer membrane receptor
MNTPLASPRATLLTGALAAMLTACASSPNPEQDEPAPDLTAEDIQRTPDMPIEKALMARVPGLWVSRAPDGSLVMRIRRQTSINASEVPLFIIDGMAFDPGPNGSLTGINPYDIESIKVLKDPTDTAMYGVRGANGVIIITTKRTGG